jgi:hypothetical protein
LKKYVFSVAAALVVALSVAGGALAAPGDGRVHSLIPSFVPRPDAWLEALVRSQQPAPAAKPAPTQQPAPQPQLKTTTLSIYEHSAQPWILADQGCSAAHRHETGIVVLDFGKPAYHHGGFGTILFSGRFAPNHKITSAMLGYARGYVSCLPDGSTATIEIARGTSNYHPSVPSA